jgi:hypothetical protein
MIRGRLMVNALSLLGTAFQLGTVAGMAPPDWRSRANYREDPKERGWGDRNFPFLIWAPHVENLGEGRPAFRGRRCPGRQQAGAPFRIDDHPLPGAYNPHGYPDTDVIACVRLDSRGAVERVQLVNGTGRAALDRLLLRTLFRRWRFVPTDGEEEVSEWQRVRLNSGDRSTPPPFHTPAPSLL